MGLRALVRSNNSGRFTPRVAEQQRANVFIQIESAGTGHSTFLVGVSSHGKDIYICEGNCGNPVEYRQHVSLPFNPFTDCIRDDQRPDFRRSPTLDFEDVAAVGTR